MNLWKIILVTVLVLVPGGSLVLLAMATAKALIASRDRLLRLGERPAPAPVVSIVQPVSASGGNG